MKKKLQLQLRRFYTTDALGSDIEKYIGLNRYELEKYVDNHLLPEMNRLNYGTIWELDHIVPIHLFDLAKEEDLYVCYNYNNLYPLLTRDNKNKGGSIHFSIELLTSLPSNEYIEQLLEICYKEKVHYDKYLG